MMRILVFTCLLLLNTLINAQKPTVMNWRATVQRQDGVEIPFTIQLQKQKNTSLMYVINASEKIKIDNIRVTTDSVLIRMPVFESQFKASVSGKQWNGVWIKATSAKEQVMPFKAEANKPRFVTSSTSPFTINVTGRWAVSFATDKTNTPASIAEFTQKGNKVTGTFLTPTGDYRFLEGVIDNKALKLSGFDGGHAFLFTADVNTTKQMTNGIFYSGAKYKETWTAVKDAKAKVKMDEAAMYLRPGEDRLNFRFKDLSGNYVSINDDRFKNKVTVIQIMGSWCPNCMDETAFLSDFYNHNKQRGIEVVSIAYEYSTDFKRSVASMQKFQKKFNVQYSMLITGVTVSDSLRTEKTLPQVTPIKVFPSSIILDKQGKVRKLDTGFYGPGTGEHYEAYKKEFYATIDELLKEK